MALPWININSKLENGVSLINSLNEAQFSEILSNLFETGTLEPQKTLKNELNSELKESLQINDDKVELLLQSLVHIYKQSMKIIIKPTMLQNQLIEYLKFDQIKAQQFVKLWSEHTKHDIGGNFEKNLHLNDILWELNLETPENKPHVLIKFNLKEKTDNSKEILMDFNKMELMELYATLETVQNRLDHLQNTN